MYLCTGGLHMWPCCVLMLLLAVGQSANSTRQQQCPQNCTCNSRMVHHHQKLQHQQEWTEFSVVCINSSYTTLPHPDTLPQNTTALHMEGNNIPVLSSVHEDCLTQLNLARNNIRHIPDKAFQRLSGLQTLSLAHNELSGLRKETFSGLQSLTSLTLEGNPIYRIQAYTLQGSNVPDLSYLKLSYCRLYEVDSNAFAGLPLYSLHTLNLSHNHLDENQFIRLNHMSLTKTLVLDLSHNKAKVIPKDVLSQLKMLHELDLSYNQITRVDPLSFRRHSNLAVIRLRGNRISLLGQQPFNGLSQLSTIDISFNNLSSLAPPEMTSHLENIILHDNPWDCTCANSWIRTDLRVTGFNFQRETKCASPAAVANQSVFKVHAERFRCDVTSERHHTLSLNVWAIVALATTVCLATAFIVFVVVMCYSRHKQQSKLKKQYNESVFTYSKLGQDGPCTAAERDQLQLKVVQNGGMVSSPDRTPV